ncbi:hypothetical protein Zmor_019812 [Zophobas morio]|uniref:Uncharacterized protein n=1 Tax=Zophobas morio TaxID=2755281 RepID=A0AA38I2F8_9CUCU|nr:hypothetical protein Zmor_019812 [Zophobas morio]
MSMFVVLLIGYLVSNCYSHQRDYCWKEYLGSVPPDAVIAGETLDGQNVYVGQAFIKNVGLIPGRVIPGDPKLHVPHDGQSKEGKYIKILCGPQDNFYWLKANSTDLHHLITDQHPVVGGHDESNGYLNVGRISVGGDTKVGKVDSFRVEHANFYYSDGQAEKLTKSYEILMYRHKILL